MAALAAIQGRQHVGKGRVVTCVVVVALLLIENASGVLALTLAVLTITEPSGVSASTTSRSLNVARAPGANVSIVAVTALPLPAGGAVSVNAGPLS